MRWAALLAALFLALEARAEDFIHLENGRILRGKVVEEGERHVVVEVGSGRIRVPRAEIKLIERIAPRRTPARTVTQRDEWFHVLHRGRLVGWRRVVLTEGPNRVQVEEQTVFFRPGGGDDVNIRRVEAADRDGRPLEFLLMETYGNKMEVVSGQVKDGKVTVQVRRDGKHQTRTLALPEGWTLALPAWARFLDRAKAGETRSIRALDLRRLRTVRVVLRREDDTTAPGETKLCRAITLARDARVARAFYRPGDGSVSVELNGKTLVARRTTRARVDLARRANAAPKPLGVDEALMFPFVRRPKELTVCQARAGFTLRAPDAAWIPAPREAERGLVLSFEKVSLFASLEVFTHAAAGDADACLSRALAKLRLTASSLERDGEAETRLLGGQPARVVRLTANHRGEDLRCILAVICAPDRHIVVIGASPQRWWRWAEPDFEAFLNSLDVVN